MSDELPVPAGSAAAATLPANAKPAVNAIAIAVFSALLKSDMNGSLTAVANTDSRAMSW